MSDPNAPQLPTGGFTFPPVSVVQYDEAGNAFYQGANGCRYYTQFPPPNVQPAPHGVPIAIAGHAQPASSSTAGSSIPIDPALIALPETPDDDLSDGPTIARAQGRTATTKVAGARRDKGKGRATESISQSKGKSQPTSRKRKCSDDEDDEPDDNSKRGRPKGAGNYTTDDVTALLDAIESERPLGMRGYQAVHRQFTQWARRNGRPERALKSLETKFKQLVKTKMPTGDAYCPPEVKRAHLIDELITERAHTRDVSDGELDGSDGADSDGKICEDDSQPAPKSTKKRSPTHRDEEDLSDVDVPVQSRQKTDKIREAIVRRPDAQAPAPARAPRNAASTLMARLSDAFDPAAQVARDTSRADRSMQNAHFLSLTQQLRDANVTIEGLRTQISVLQTSVHNAERARDRAELKLEMLQLSHSANPVTPGPQQPMQPPHRPSRHRTRSHRSRRPPRSPETVALLQRTNGKSRVVHRYPDGGSWTTWVTDPSSESGSESDLGSSEKENLPPQSSSSRVRYTTSQKGSTRRRLSYEDEDNDHSYIIPPPSAFRHPSPFFASQPVFSTLDTNTVADNVEGSAESSKDAE